MSKKAVRNPYSKPLLKIYETARKFVDDFEPTITNLINGEDVCYQPLRRRHKTQVAQVNDSPLSFENRDVKNKGKIIAMLTN